VGFRRLRGFAEGERGEQSLARWVNASTSAGHATWEGKLRVLIRDRCVLSVVNDLHGERHGQLQGVLRARFGSAAGTRLPCDAAHSRPKREVHDLGYRSFR
jgi:hypothetical protein